MFDGNFRKSVDATTAPVGQWLVRRGVSADVLTASGLAFAALTAWSIGVGYHYLAIVLLALTGFHDMLDGAVAKASHRASQRGSFFDSVIDRVSDALLMGGVAYYLTAHDHGQLVLDLAPAPPETVNHLRPPGSGPSLFRPAAAGAGWRCHGTPAA